MNKSVSPMYSYEDMLATFTAPELAAARYAATRKRLGAKALHQYLVAHQAEHGWETVPNERQLDVLLSRKDQPRYLKFQALIAYYRAEAVSARKQDDMEAFAAQSGQTLSRPEVHTVLLGRLRAIASVTPADYYDADGQRIPLHSLPERALLALKDWDSLELYSPMEALKLMQKQVEIDLKSPTGQGAIAEDKMLSAPKVPPKLLGLAEEPVRA